MSDDLPEFAYIAAGPFSMGSEDGAPDERPAHVVKLRAYAIGLRPVTNAEYARFVRETNHPPPAVGDLPLVVTSGGEDRELLFRSAAEPYVWIGKDSPADRRDHPVTMVRWDDALAYCQWLSATLGRIVRLPTEAEWEKAARGGVEGQRYPWGDNIDLERANYRSDPPTRTIHGTTRVGTYAANGYGLFDVAGNVWEWVQDWYDAEYYASSPEVDPAGPDSGQFRIVRGGGWVSTEPKMLSCSYRHHVPTDTYSYAIGFRVACVDR
jgi:formylglycine-generating enzyme